MNYPLGIFPVVNEISQLGIFLVIIIVFLNYFSNQKTKKDEEIIKQAILALERAYEVLTDRETHISPPLKDPYNWLTTARMLVRYEKLKKRLRSNLYKTICEAQEEYWRHKFYLLVKEPALYPISYFEQSGDKTQIQPKSALVIFGFAGRKEGKIDPLDKFNSEYYFATLSPDHRDLMKYLIKSPKSPDN